MIVYKDCISVLKWPGSFPIQKKTGVKKAFQFVRKRLMPLKPHTKHSKTFSSTNISPIKCSLHIYSLTSSFWLTVWEQSVKQTCVFCTLWMFFLKSFIYKVHHQWCYFPYQTTSARQICVVFKVMRSWQTDAAISICRGANSFRHHHLTVGLKKVYKCHYLTSINQFGFKLM